MNSDSNPDALWRFRDTLRENFYEAAILVSNMPVKAAEDGNDSAFVAEIEKMSDQLGQTIHLFSDYAVMCQTEQHIKECRSFITSALDDHYRRLRDVPDRGQRELARSLLDILQYCVKKAERDSGLSPIVA